MNSVCVVTSIQQSELWCGTYILHIRFTSSLRLAVGRMNGGRPIGLEAGEYVYIGSAMGSGGLYLPRRILRHASREGDLPVHACYERLVSHFTEAGIPLKLLLPRGPKRRRWNIDFVLDSPGAELSSVLYIRSDRRHEARLVEYLEARQDTKAPIVGLGAHDHRGHTHFLQIVDDGWPALVQDIRDRIEPRSDVGVQP